MGPRQARRRARPSAAEDRLACVREDRRSPRVSLPRQRRGRARRHAGESSPRSTTRCSTRSGRRPIAGSASPARICPAPGPPPSSSPGTTATPTTRGSSSTSRSERAVVIGNGNVALDVARMLALTREELASTDTTDAAIEAIVSSGIREIVVVGRRGPVQAAWTSTELGSSASSPARTSSSTPPSSSSIQPAPPSSRPRRTSSSETSRSSEGSRRVEPVGKPRAVRLRFPRVSCRDRRRGARRGGRARSQPARARRARIRSRRADGERELVSCGIVFRSVGYRGTGIPGVPFDERAGTIPNADGRVLDAAGRRSRPLLRGLDQAGPTGVIGTNKKDATETVERLLEDARAARFPRARRRHRGRAHRARARGRRVRRLGGDRPARAVRGEPHGRPRVKLASWDELLAAARSA